VRIHAWVCIVVLTISGCGTSDPYEAEARRALEGRHAFADQIAAGATLELVQIAYQPTLDRSAGVHGYPTRSEPVVVAPELARDLAALLRNDDRFYVIYTKACGFSPGYAFRLKTRDSPALLICFDCDDILVARADRAPELTPIETSHCARGELARLLLRALPDDPELQRIPEEPKYENCP
jgi:hypothetical protein